jgi:2-phosphosulfolactate phosphatase
VSAGIHFDWGIAGARAAHPGGALVVVDVLSFSTSTTIATGRGTAVYPHPWPSPDVEAFAAAHDAQWAVGRRKVSETHPWSLSPSQLAAAPSVERLVLPSPNGSTIAAMGTNRVLAGSVLAGCLLAGCLRNATAVARWLADHGFGTAERPVTVIAAGEQWPGSELRPALEDLMGAAAIIAAFGAEHARSPEASATEAVWPAHRRRADELLLGCYSGRELVERGYTADVALAAAHDAQTTVPVLTDGAFLPV